MSKDKHIRVIYGPEIVKRIRAREGRSEEEKEKERQRALMEARRMNFGFQELKLLDGNIGYLDLRGFSGFREAAAIEEAVLKKYVGFYAEGEILLENGQIFVLARGKKIKLIPLSLTYFVPEDDSEIQVEFVLDKEGKEYEIIGHFRDGGKQRLSRVKEKK